MKEIDAHAHFWADCWETARKSSSLYNHGYDESRWQDFWNQYSGTYIKINRVLMEKNQDTVRRWVDEGLINSDSRVLDIGCGPGTYAIPLARAVKEVVCLDTAPAMLEALRETAAAKSLNNIVAVNGHWEEVGYEKEFDFVIAAKSPAVYNYETLYKMNFVSRRYCLLLSYRKYRSQLRELLWEKLKGEKLKNSAFDIVYPFNILYKEGYNPEVRFFSEEYRVTEEANVIKENFKTYFRIFGCEGPDTVRIIEETVDSFSQGGMFTEKAEATITTMWWDVS